MSVRYVAIIAVALASLTALFQLALALGAPWAEMSWGGRFTGVLPNKYRIASGVVALLFFPIVIYGLLGAGGLVETGISPVAERAELWVFAGLFALSTLGNLASQSKRERWWAPVALAIGVSCGYLATQLG